jgi:RNA polymerase sigma-70 factor (ECF subfamily)
VVSTGRNPIVGRERVIRFFVGILDRRGRDTRDVTVEPILVNGDAGVLIRGYYLAGSPLLSVLTVAVADGRITAVYNQLSPAKLSSVGDR